ncbi:MAG: Nif3-like dinuclear metal center hexameric protein [Chitinophagales bacterium]
MRIFEVVSVLEDFAPLSVQEKYDNCGLLTGSMQSEVHGILLALDCTEHVLREALEKGCDMVITHHPLIFSPLKNLSGSDPVTRTLLFAIKNDIAIYAIHTNLDNVQDGVNRMIADKLELVDRSVLSPVSGRLRKLVTFAPHAAAAEVRDALFAAGAGHIGKYDRCSFNLEGSGTFRPGANADPHVGKIGEEHTEPETRIEVIYPDWREKNILQALFAAHPYEEVAYDIYRLENAHPEIGAGLIGKLEKPMAEADFLDLLKEKMGAGVVRYTELRGTAVEKVAVCGGSGSFLIRDAIQAGAEVFVTADLKYHQFFEADGRIVLADIGHFESEQYTPILIGEILREKFTNFALHFSSVKTNPINYL